jgi:hypothetical protein
MTERLTYWVMIAALIILALLQRTCTKPCPPTLNTISTKTDTVWITNHTHSPVYTPVSKTTIKKPRPVKTDYEVIPLTDNSYVLLNAELEKRRVEADTSGDVELTVYQDTTYMIEPIKGYFVITDTVDGRLISRRIDQNYRLPVIVNNTTTYTPAAKPRSQIYVGGEVWGSPANILEYGGVSLALKTKRDVIYEVKTMTRLQGGPQLFGVGIKTKLSFRPF